MIWIYTPGSNKNDWREGEDTPPIPLGKLEQEILGPRLVGKSDDDYVFSPRDTERERRERDAAKRKTKVQPSQLKRKEQATKNPKRKVKDFYTTASYGKSVTKAIERANKRLPDGENIPHWTVYQLRHAAISEIVKRTGSVDIARAVAGQKSITVTLGYNHADDEIAEQEAKMRKAG